MLFIITSLSLLTILFTFIYVFILQKKYQILSEHSNSIQRELNQVREVNAQYRGEVTYLESEKIENDKLKQENIFLQKKISSLEEREKSFFEKEKTFKEEFYNISRSILDDSAYKLSIMSSGKLDEALKPFNEKLNEFSKKVQDVYYNEEKERHVLKTEIENLIKTSDSMRTQSEDLTKALKGDSKLRGNWGEIQLLRVLETSGLVQGQDYIVQGEGLKLTNTVGNSQYPDVIINLPDKKKIIIDSKVNLVHYEKYINGESLENKKNYLDDFIRSVRSEVNNLSKKEYHLNEKILSPDFVIMFMPIESAYHLSLSKDVTLHNFAWNKKVILASPTVLFATLKAVAYGISNDKRNKNIEKIAKQSSLMYDKFSDFVENMEKIGKSIRSSQDSYDQAIRQLSEGKGNLISKAKKLRELGVDSNKNTLNKYDMEKDSLELIGDFNNQKDLFIK